MMNKHVSKKSEKATNGAASIHRNQPLQNQQANRNFAGRAAEITNQNLSPASIIELQSLIGNQAVIRLLRANGEQLSPQITPASIQRDLVRQPPGRVADPPQLTEQQMQEAIAFNTARFQSAEVIDVVQDIIGAQRTGVYDEQTVHMISEWQADFRLPVDGKIGAYTLRPIVQEVIALGQQNTAIRMIMDGHNLWRRGLQSIRYDPALGGSNAVTDPVGAMPCDSTVRIGPIGFAQGYPGLVHTIAHEMLHVEHNLTGASMALGEFQSESLEILSRGMIQEHFAGFMDDAQRALDNWNAMTVVEKRGEWARFQQIRTKIQQRFNSQSAATQATHQPLMDAYNAVAAP